MLTALHIQDFVLIDDVSLSFGGGLTALTGETGAGKSILLEALGLVVGARATRAAVRKGARQGVVTAAFEPDQNNTVWPVLEEAGFDSDDDQIILRRIQKPDGKGRAFVNGQPASIATLRAIGGALLEVHGQHDGRGFMNVATHRALLDAYAGIEARVSELRAIHARRRAAQAALDDRRASFEKDAREADYLRFVVDELSALGVCAGDEARLSQRRAELNASEKVGEDIAAAHALLSDEGLEGKLSQAARRLARAAAGIPAEAGPLEAAIERIDRTLSEAMEARAALDEAAHRFSFDLAELEETEARLFAIRAMARKHGVEPDRLPDVLAAAEAALQRASADGATGERLEREVRELGKTYLALAGELTEARRAAGDALSAAVARELEPLKLGAARFIVDVSPRPDEEHSGDGVDHVEFMVATNRGAEPGPLKTVASGGELSRFVLAMKAALAAKESRTVIIFDEVDAGVGGAVADAVGERLASLARDAQVLVVTHSPQVAARADAHLLVEKAQEPDRASTTVRRLGADARVEEIARMLSGAEITNEARAAAARLLGAPARRPARRKSA
ncbi:MAG: DNA repair protein RecN [Alphaproteobacteria bacterium]|nr:DNA repair protein RecN [Alphaproteobacteria bacterium]